MTGRHAPVPNARCLPDSPTAATFDFLERHAAVDPARTALVVGDESFSFGRFHADAMRFSQVLAERRVTRGQLVYVCHPHLYVEWLLLIACENVGAASASFASAESLAAAAARERADFVFADTDLPPGGGRAAHTRVDRGWLEQVLGRDLREVRAHPRVVLGPDEPQRLTHSSGTTGAPKAMLFRRGEQEAKLDIILRTGGCSRETRLLAALPFAVNSTYLLATACLRLGALVVAAPLPVAVARDRVDCFDILPVALDQLLRELPRDFVKPAQLTVKVIGAPLTRRLRERALRSLCTDISSRYATNEVWPIVPDMDVDQGGTLQTGVDVRILDDRDEDVAPGQVGRVAVRAPWMVDGYLDDPDATRTQFRDGWFLTGDLGALLPGRRLKLAGRSDELLNLGGLKASPLAMEAEIGAIPGVVAAAATSVSADGAIDDLCVAVVLEDGVDLARVQPQIEAAATGWQRLQLKQVPALPTTAQGKLSRAGLRRLFAAA